jgi:hypothetical protein
VNGNLLPLQASDGSWRHKNPIYIWPPYWHCIDGAPGSYHAKHPNGYDNGAQDLADDIQAPAKTQH